MTGRLYVCNAVNYLGNREFTNMCPNRYLGLKKREKTVIFPKKEILDLEKKNFYPCSPGFTIIYLNL